MNVLKKIQVIRKRIEQLESVYDEIYARFTSGTHTYSQTLVLSSSDPHKIDQIAIVNEKMEKAVNELLELKIFTLNWMYGCPELSSLKRCIILLRYFFDNTYLETAVALDYSLKHIMRIHKTIIAFAPEVD